MNKLNLKEVTLVCIDDIDPWKSAHIIRSLIERIEFADSKLFSSKDGDYITDKISPINSLKDYSAFAIKELYKYVDSKFVMFIQRDGYPLNLKAWQSEFLDYDYIGAPWNWVPIQGRAEHCPTGMCVGNGGFSIRSTALMKAAAEYDYTEADEDEDIFLCRTKGEDLKSKGYKFAPVELASYFSTENGPYRSQFGFHGPKTLEVNKKLKIFNFKDHAYERDYMD
jgi:hypothetical protein